MTGTVRRSASRAVHLADGFVRALWPGDVSATDDEWVRQVLTPAEQRCWASMPRSDRREGIRTAKRLRAELRSDPEGVVAAAALLHDVGKSRSGLGPFGRALATLAAAMMPRRLERWGGTGGFRNRFYRYAHHAAEGQRLLSEAGARPEVAAWAGAHHTPSAWAGSGLCAGVEAALARADGEPAGFR